MMTSLNIRRFSFLLLSIVGISLLHYLTPLNLPMLHDIFQRLYYVPIIFAAFWFGFKGGILCALLASVAYAPHILIQWGAHFSLELEKYLEIVLFNVIGGITGLLSDMEKARRRQLQRTAEGLEESLRKQRIQAEHIIEIKAQLQKAERLSTVGEMAAMMAHEIRNPLGSIKGTAEILKDDFQPGERKYEFLEILVKESDRLNHFIEDFLRLAKPQTISLERCDIMEQLTTITTLVDAEAKGRGIHLELKPAELPVIEGDPEKLRQAFLNVTLNALQATPPGSAVTISAIVEESEVDQTSWVKICVSDKGPGLTPETHQQLIQPFFTTKEGGVGLGLAITKRIIEGHGGRIDAESVPGEGTTFCIRLPKTLRGNDGADNSDH